MPYLHPEDKRAQRRAYYRTHKEKIKAQAAGWYSANKDDISFKRRKREYMREYRWRRKRGA